MKTSDSLYSPPASVVYVLQQFYFNYATFLTFINRSAIEKD
jgi:hypothetical protein